MMPAPPYRLMIGWDAAQMRAWVVAQMSARTHASAAVDVTRIAIQNLRAQGLYYRPTGHTEDGYWDDISAAPMSTGHAIARFLVPYLCNYSGWALFTDGDVLFRKDVAQLFALADPRYAVQVVKHTHVPTDTVKMTGQAQTQYARKNWSSVVLWNAGHPANRALTVDLVNTVPGRDLHRFCWLEDELVGALPPDWNLLVGEQWHPDPAIAHFTRGTPDMDGYDEQPFAEEWFAHARASGYKLRRRQKQVSA